MAVDLAKIAKDRKIKYFFISFVDLFGVLRAKLVPARAIGGMQREASCKRSRLSRRNPFALSTADFASCVFPRCP